MRALNNIRIGGLILSRFDSQRLPGKTLLNLGTKPLIKWPIDALNSHPNILPIITTTNRPIDNPLMDIEPIDRILSYRGDTLDIAKRIIDCCSEYNLDYFFRVNGDSPFINIPLLTQAIALLNHSKFDIITNLINRSYPYGLSCELIKVSTFSSLYSKFSDFQKEHITDFYYKNLNKITFAELPILDKNYSKLDWAVDTKEDLERLSSYISKTSYKDINTTDITELIIDYEKHNKAE